LYPYRVVINLGTVSAAALSLGAAAVWGGGDFAGGIATKRASVFRVVAGAHACGLGLMLLLAWATGEAVPPRSSLEWGVVAGVSGAFGIAALYQALAIGRMGIIAPVASVITAILPVLVGIRTEGLPDPIQLAGFALALVSIWLVARPAGEIDSHRGLGLAVLAGVMFGVFLVAGKQAGHHGVFWPLVAARAASTVLMLIIVAFSHHDTRPLRAAVVPILLSGLFDSLANAMFIAATRHGRLDVAAVLSSLYPASTVILARVLLREHLSASQNAGIIGALASVALISAK
jgi:drug/metabolite transporter (DMT)-like permease